MAFLMGKHDKQTVEFNNLNSWRQLREWLLRESPLQLEGNKMMLLLKSYNNQAKELREQRKLRKDFEWMC